MNGFERQNIEQFIIRAILFIITFALMIFFIFHMCYVTCTFTADIEIRLFVRKVTCKLNKVNNARIMCCFSCSMVVSTDI